MKYKYLIFAFAIAGFIFSTVALAQEILPAAGNVPNSEIKIDKDGKMTVSNAAVVQIAGSTFYARPTWGTAFIRLIVKTINITSFTRKYGEVISVSDIKEGDLLDISGTLDYGSSQLAIIASSVKNLSDQKQANVFSGTITAIDPSSDSFSLFTKSSTITVSMGASAAIIKGSRTVDFGHLKIGDKVLSANGVFDHASNTLTASNIKVYLDMSVFKSQNFQGTIQSIGGTSLPATLAVKVPSGVYTVRLSANTQILNNKKNSALLQRFVVGDIVRFYGNIVEADEPIIDNVEVIRNLNL